MSWFLHFSNNNLFSLTFDQNTFLLFLNMKTSQTLNLLPPDEDNVSVQQSRFSISNSWCSFSLHVFISVSWFKGTSAVALNPCETTQHTPRVQLKRSPQECKHCCIATMEITRLITENRRCPHSHTFTTEKTFKIISKHSHLLLSVLLCFLTVTWKQPRHGSSLKEKQQLCVHSVETQACIKDLPRVCWDVILPDSLSRQVMCRRRIQNLLCLLLRHASFSSNPTTTVPLERHPSWLVLRRVEIQLLVLQ